MKNFYVMCMVSSLMFGWASALGVETTSEERTALKKRADALQPERQRNASADGGERRLNEPPRDVRLNQNRGEVNTKAKSAVPKPRGEGVNNKVKRTVKDLPGALVRRSR